MSGSEPLVQLRGDFGNAYYHNEIVKMVVDSITIKYYVLFDTGLTR